jgi:hypothetical protein
MDFGLSARPITARTASADETCMASTAFHIRFDLRAGDSHARVPGTVYSAAGSRPFSIYLRLAPRRSALVWPVKLNRIVSNLATAAL